MNEIKTGAKIEGGAASSDRETMQSLIDKGVEYCMPLYVDVHGIAKTKTVPVSHFDRMMRGSELFTGAALDGLGQGPHDDELAVLPDPRCRDAACRGGRNVAVIPGQLTYHEQPYPMCSRTVLAKQIERAAKLGLKFNLGIECETYIVRRDPSAHNGIAPNDPRDTIAKAAYDASLTLLNLELLNDIVSSMNKLGWEVHSFDHEDANGQFEFDFAYADVMTMADRFVVWRMMMKELARKHGFEATMMAKPYADRTGSGAHFNMSLADINTGKNVSGDASDKRGCGLSKRAYQFLGGLRKHAAAIVAVSCPTVNSYKRLIKTGSMTGYTWAPIFISYGGNNRTHMFRVPMLRPQIEGSEPATATSTSPARGGNAAPSIRRPIPILPPRCFWAPGSTASSRTSIQAIPSSSTCTSCPTRSSRSAASGSCRETLLEAITAFEQDDLGRRVMGDELYQSYIDLKKSEWWSYHNSISQWEIDEYLTKF